MAECIQNPTTPQCGDGAAYGSLNVDEAGLQRAPVGSGEGGAQVSVGPGRHAVRIG